MKVFVIIMNECLSSINPFPDTSPVWIIIWSSVQRIKTLHFIGCMITLILLLSSLAMFTFQINLSEILFALFQLKPHWTLPPQQKYEEVQYFFHATLSWVKLMDWILLSFLVRLIRALNYCMYYYLENFWTVKYLLGFS